MAPDIPNGVVALRNVGFSYPIVQPEAGQKSFRLSSISFRLVAGRLLSLLGPSGSGKTSLAQITAGLLSPTQGDVERDPSVDGCAYVFQSPRLVPWLSVVENIRFAAGDVDKRYLNDMLGELGLGDVPDCLPHQLSGGMKQRCALARALASSHKLLILDEPFGGTDFLLREKLYKLVDAELSRGRAGLLITHDVPEALGLADEVLVLGGSPSTIIDRLNLAHFPRPNRSVNPDFQLFVADAESRIRSDFGNTLGPRGAAI